MGKMARPGSAQGAAVVTVTRRGHMAKREVKATGKDDQGDITKLCHSGAAWSPRSKRDAISDIDDGTHSYFVAGPGGAETKIVVIGAKGTTGRYLRTDPDSTTRNNLSNLPDC
jgi:hypothetical protein